MSTGAIVSSRACGQELVEGGDRLLPAGGPVVRDPGPLVEGVEHLVNGDAVVFLLAVDAVGRHEHLCGGRVMVSISVAARRWSVCGYVLSTYEEPSALRSPIT